MDKLKQYEIENRILYNKVNHLKELVQNYKNLVEKMIKQNNEAFNRYSFDASIINLELDYGE